MEADFDRIKYLEIEGQTTLRKIVSANEDNAISYEIEYK